MKLASLLLGLASTAALAIPPFPPPTQRPNPLTLQHPLPEKLSFQSCFGEKELDADKRHETVKLTLIQPGIFGSETIGQLVKTFWIHDHDIPSAISAGLQINRGSSLDGSLSFETRLKKPMALDWDKTLDGLKLRFDQKPDPKAVSHGKLTLTLDGEAEVWDVECHPGQYARQ